MYGIITIVGRPKLKDAKITGVLANPERQYEDGRRMIKLRRGEQRELRERQLVEGAIALFLDLEGYRTWDQIAEELGISTSKLRDLTKSDLFDELYNKMFGELGHDPRYLAAQAELSNLLPVALRELKRLLTSENTPPTTRLKAVENIIRWNQLEIKQQQVSNRRELAEFLDEVQVGNTINIILPAEYEKAMEEADIIEGELVEESVSSDECTVSDPVRQKSHEI